MDLLDEYGAIVHKPIIEVEYDGRYPNTCRGTLKITVDSDVIYHEKYCCYSTGNVWFDDEGDEHVEEGKLLWNEDEAIVFSGDIQQAVRNKLSEFHVCCGGCV